MNKSILVIDTPENCRSCKLLDRESGKHCSVNFYGQSCPLVNLPQKKNIVEQTSRKKMKQNLRAQGFNACIDEILKGANGNE